MITKISRVNAPFYVQFELTEKCNNKCFFCYNPLGYIGGKELSLAKIKDILRQLADAKVFRVNFNGGEPLMRDDFCEIVEYAYDLGLELHMNTNSTLVTEKIAGFVSRYMKSICTSILHSQSDIHDKMTGRTGAYNDVLRGIGIWRNAGIKVEVNVCTSTLNYSDIYNIGKLLSEHDCYALCSTRYILTGIENRSLLVNGEQTMELIDLLLKVKEDFPCISDVSLPGPVPYCEVDETYYDKLRLLNIPCQYGYGLARISATGKITPCTISDDTIGDLNTDSFKEIWAANGWAKYESLCHIPTACRSCEELRRCKGGCVVYDESIIASGEKVGTKKWSITK